MNVAVFSDSRPLAERHTLVLRELLGWNTAVGDLDAVLEHEPDVLLLDYAAAPVACGMLRLIRFRHVATPAALIVSSLDVDSYRAATDLGVTGVLQRGRSSILLADCLCRVAAGKTCIDGLALLVR
ncbi:MAG TPA: hypothetical protein VGF48_06795 [Thermoanaerobaculia bacterium]